MYQEYIDEIKRSLDAIAWDSLDHVVKLLHGARISNRNIFIFGNGGSATTAQHMVCDLTKNTRSNLLPPFRVISLSDNTALFSAFANDEGYDNVFTGQLHSFLESRDVVIAISASGNSPNILSAVNFARDTGAHTVGLSGYDGGALAQLVDFPIVVPNHCMEQIEDIHLMIAHMITSALRAKARDKAVEATMHCQLKPEVDALAIYPPAEPIEGANGASRSAATS